MPETSQQPLKEFVIGLVLLIILVALLNLIPTGLLLVALPLLGRHGIFWGAYSLLYTPTFLATFIVLARKVGVTPSA